MTISVTDWRGRMTPLDILVNVEGEDMPVPVLYGTTTPIFVDMTEQLATGEEIEPDDVEVTVRMLPAKNEADYADASTVISGPVIVEGAIIEQRLHNLARGRVYRLEILFGASDQRRGASILVQCTE